MEHRTTVGSKKKEMTKELFDKNFKPVVALKENRFNIWKILDAHKDEENLLVTFNSLEGNKKYACIPLEKLLELLYRQ